MTASATPSVPSRGPSRGPRPRPAEDGPKTTGELAELIAERARACPGVAGLTAGPWGHVVTYRPGRPLPGVAVRDDEVRVSLIVLPERPVTETAEEVGAAIAPLADGREVHVIVADVTPDTGG